MSFDIFRDIILCHSLSLSHFTNLYRIQILIFFLVIIFKENEFSSISGMVVVILNIFPTLMTLVLPLLLFSWHLIWTLFSHLCGSCLTKLDFSAPAISSHCGTYSYAIIVGSWLLCFSVRLWNREMRVYHICSLSWRGALVKSSNLSHSLRWLWNLLWELGGVLLLVRAARGPADLSLLPSVLQIIALETCNCGCPGSSYFGLYQGYLAT